MTKFINLGRLIDKSQTLASHYWHRVNSLSSASGLYTLYDNLTGLDRVHTVHDKLASSERLFTNSQLERKLRQAELFRLEEARQSINLRLDRMQRSEEGYLALVTELLKVSNEHKAAHAKLEEAERGQESAFEDFSSLLRLSQAEERIHANRMRQWSIGLSVVTGFLAFLSTWYRYRQVRRQLESLEASRLTATTTVGAADFASIDTSSLMELNDASKKLIHTTNVLIDHQSDTHSRLQQAQLSQQPIEKPGWSIRDYATTKSIGFTLLAVLLVALTSSR